MLFLWPTADRLTAEITTPYLSSSSTKAMIPLTFMSVLGHPSSHIDLCGISPIISVGRSIFTYRPYKSAATAVVDTLTALPPPMAIEPIFCIRTV